jgi:protein SCO1/2
MRWVGLLIVFGLLWSCSTTSDSKKRVLPIIGNSDVVYKTVDGKTVTDTVYPRIPEFSMLNQDSVKVSSTTLKGNIWIADFFFTSCSTICPGMTAKMKSIQEKLKDLSKDIQFISFSIDPEKDQPSVMRKYIKTYGINDENWVFLTGNEEVTHELGVDHFFIHAASDPEAVDGYAHAEAFSLVDKEGYVRGVYNVQNPDELKRLEKEVRLLLKEEYGIVGSK